MHRDTWAAYRIATRVSRYVSRCHKRYVNACIAIRVQILSIYSPFIAQPHSWRRTLLEFQETVICQPAVTGTRKLLLTKCLRICDKVTKGYIWARIHESVITYDGHISRPGITELELGPSENSYSRARKRSVIVVVLEVSGFHTGCLVTKRFTAHGRRGLFVQLDNQVGSDIIT